MENNKNKAKRGIYETDYGNAAFIDGDYAYDLDMGEKIPIEVVTNKFIREAEKGDDKR